jgi:hypothetical protein
MVGASSKLRRAFFSVPVTDTFTRIPAGAMFKCAPQCFYALNTCGYFHKTCKKSLRTVFNHLIGTLLAANVFICVIPIEMPDWVTIDGYSERRKTRM